MIIKSGIRKRSHIAKPKVWRIVEIILIVILILIGIFGQVHILYFVPRTLNRVPLLSSKHWDEGHEMFHSPQESTRNIAHQGERSFETHLEKNGGWMSDEGAYITQYLVWREVPTQFKEFIDNPQSDFWPYVSLQRPVQINEVSTSNPNSKLYCENVHREQFRCFYFAHFGNWYTEVEFLSGSQAALGMDEIYRLITVVDDLLVDAPGCP